MKHGYMVMTETKQQSLKWKRVKFTATSSPCWSFFFYIQSIVHKEFTPRGQTVNGKFYCEVLKRLREGIRRKRPDKWKKNNWFLHHDNAPASHITHCLKIPDFQKHYCDSPPPYSPDLALCDFFLYPKMKLQLKGHHFDTTEEIHAESHDVINTLTFQNFQGCVQSWKKRWDRCIHAQGDYFNGDSGN